MNLRTLSVALLAGAVSMSIAPVMALAQNEAAAYRAPRTSYGHPDLAGTWTNASLTNLTRPAEYGDRLVMTPEEARRVEVGEADFRALRNQPTRPGVKMEDLPCSRGFTGANCGYNAGWSDPGTEVMTVGGEKRTSFLTTPNGQIPPRRAGAPTVGGRRGAVRGGTNSADNPETRTLAERCLSSFGSSAGPIMQSQLYNNTYQFAQSKDAFAIWVEMVHDVRVIRIGGKHLPSHVRPWMGDSIGRWEGETLVAETTNFPQTTNLGGSSENLKVVERFTRVGPGRILYRFTVEDPTVWDAPWGGEYEFKTSSGPVYEYACHEGNYALEGILAGARVQEQDAAPVRPDASSR